MKRGGVAFMLACLLGNLTAGGPPGSLSITKNQGQIELTLPQRPVAPVGGGSYVLRIESSGDLESWHGEELMEEGAQGRLSYLPATNRSNRFYRLADELVDSDVAPTGDELFGYQRVFDEELRRVGFLTPEEFRENHEPSADFISQISFDPRTADFWDRFNADPDVVNEGLTSGDPGWRAFDFRLNESEMDVFLKNGFVVSERLGSDRFAEVFYRIFNDDLPVFVSADSVLHAWHFSFQHMLSEMEELHLAPVLEQILDGMSEELARLPDAVLEGPLADSVTDADYYLTVGRSLMKGETVASQFGTDEDVQRTLNDIEARAQYFTPPGFSIFGTNRLTDFSQFEPRAYYTRSPQLTRYFQAFMWTARTDFRMLAAEPTPQSLRELGTAITLCQLLESSGMSGKWAEMDSLLTLFIGPTDAMTFTQLKPLLDASSNPTLESINSTGQLADLQRAIFTGDLGLQLIPGDAYLTPFGPAEAQLPRAFVLTGQRFNPDGWSLSKVTFDRVHWSEEIPGSTVSQTVLRRVPTALDTAYAVLGNKEVGFKIAERMLAPRVEGDFQNGFPYAHNLTALAATFDRMESTAWRNSIYTRWLDALRALSEPTTGPAFPESMRSRAWAMKNLNTQLASYTELKHDTVLYAKQPYASIFLCEYPAGFIEPVPEFWKRMREMAEATAEAMSHYQIVGSMFYIDENVGLGKNIDFGERHRARVAHCSNFAQTMAILEEMALKELSQEPFTQDEEEFIRGLMNSQDHPYVGPSFDGWYPDLYYKDYALEVGSADENGSNKADFLTTDVFTAPPDEIDPVGGILQEATGPVDLLMIAVDNGLDKMVYAGPVMSHFEFVVPGPDLKRLTNDQWKAMHNSADRPARPEWTRSHLVPVSE